MSEVIGVKIKVSAEELSGLQSKLKEATQNVADLTAEFGAGSAKVAAAALEVEKLQQQIAQNVEPTALNNLAEAIKAVPDIQINDEDLTKVLNDSGKLSQFIDGLKTDLSSVDADGFSQVASILGGLENQLSNLANKDISIGRLDEANKELAQLTEQINGLPEPFANTDFEAAKKKVEDLQAEIGKQVIPLSVVDLADAIKNLPSVEINDDQLKEVINDSEKLGLLVNDLKGQLTGIDGESFVQITSVIKGAEAQIETLNASLADTGEQIEKADKPFNLKRDLKEATLELQKAQAQFGEFSDEAVAAAKKVAGLKEQIADAGELAANFDSGKKFQAYAGAVQGVAGAYAGLQGALGLVGVESENVQKQLLKVQSAMAFAQGLAGIQDGVKSFKTLGAVIQSTTVFQKLNNAVTATSAAITRAWGVAVNTTSTSFKVLKGAIAATGIGAAVIAIGLLITNFDKVKQAVLNFIPGLGKVADFLGNLINKVTDFIGVTSEAERQVAKTIAANDKAIKDSERNLDLNGDKYDQYTQRKIKANNEFKKAQNEFLKDEKLSEDERNAYILQAREKANREIARSEKDRQDADKEAKKKEKDKADAEAKTAADKRKQQNAELAAAEKAAAQELKKIKDDILLAGIKDETERKKKALEIQTADEIKKVTENEKLKAETKAALIKGIEEKAAVDLEAINEERRVKEAEAEKNFQEQLSELQKEIQLAAIKDKDQRDIQAIKDGFEKRREAIIESTKDDSARQTKLLEELKVAENQALQAKQEEIDRSNLDKNLTKLEADAANNELSFQQRVEALDKEQQLLQESFDKKLLTEEEYNEKAKKLSKDRIAVEMQEKEAKKAINDAYLDIAANFATLASGIFEKSKGVQVAGLIVEQAAAIGKVISNIGIANAKSVAASPITGGMPWVGINTVSGALSIASIVANTAKSISQIKSQNGSGGGASGASIPKVSAAAPMAPPAPEAAVTKLDQTSLNTIGSATTRAYVVESDVTGTQQRIKRIQRAARLG